MQSQRGRQRRCAQGREWRRAGRRWCERASSAPTRGALGRCGLGRKSYGAYATASSASHDARGQTVDGLGQADERWAGRLGDEASHVPTHEQGERADRQHVGSQQTLLWTEKAECLVVMTDRIIGCPHEEGIDYEGTTCPTCPFWAGRDRWTGKRLH